MAISTIVRGDKVIARFALRSRYAAVMTVPAIHGRMTKGTEYARTVVNRRRVECATGLRVTLSALSSG